MVPLGRHRPRRFQGSVPLGRRKESIGYAESGPCDDHGVALVGLGLASEQLRRTVGRKTRQIRRVEPGRSRPPQGERPDVADLVDHHEGVSRLREQLVELALAIRYGTAEDDLAFDGDKAGPVRALADVEPENGGVRMRCWLHDGILPISRSIGCRLA